MLIRRALTNETDLDGFHALEQQVQTAWMPQALACIAVDLLIGLTEATAKLSPFGKKSTPEELLDDALNIIMFRQMWRGET